MIDPIVDISPAVLFTRPFTGNSHDHMLYNAADSFTNVGAGASIMQDEDAGGFWYKLAGTLAFAGTLSILPFHDDLCIHQTNTCPREIAQQCMKEFLICQGVRANGIGSNQIGAIRAAGMAAVKCEAAYDDKCPTCGRPVDTGGYFERLAATGPWYLKLIPGARSYWAKYLGIGAARDRCVDGVLG